MISYSSELLKIKSFTKEREEVVFLSPSLLYLTEAMQNLCHVRRGGSYNKQYYRNIPWLQWLISTCSSITIKLCIFKVLSPLPTSRRRWSRWTWQRSSFWTGGRRSRSESYSYEQTSVEWGKVTLWSIQCRERQAVMKGCLALVNHASLAGSVEQKGFAMGSTIIVSSGSTKESTFSKLSSQSCW